MSCDAQGTDSREPHDPLKVAIWQALLPFREELLATGGVTFMGLRNAIAEAVRPFARDDWRSLYEQTDANAPHDLCACRIGQCDRLTVRCREMTDAPQA